MSGIFGAAILLLFPAVSRLYNTVLIGESHKNVPFVCVTASAVFSPGFQRNFHGTARDCFQPRIRVLVFPVRVFTKNCMMLRNLYCFSRNKRQNFLSLKSENTMASKGTGAIHRSSWRSVVAFFAFPFYCFSPLYVAFTTLFR